MSNGLPPHIAQLRKLRIAIPPHIESKCETFPASQIFDFLDKNSGLTEEFIYNNTNPALEQYPVYTASYEPIGYLPADTLIGEKPLKVCRGECIIIFRQGYAGKMYIPKEQRFFASEHTIPVRAKPEYRERLNHYWFIKYYEPEVFHYVTGKADSGNFSALAFKKIPIQLPPREWQDECALLYRRMDESLEGLQEAMDSLRVSPSRTR